MVAAVAEDLRPYPRVVSITRSDNGWRIRCQLYNWCGKSFRPLVDGKLPPNWIRQTREKGELDGSISSEVVYFCSDGCASEYCW